MKKRPKFRRDQVVMFIENEGKYPVQVERVNEYKGGHYAYDVFGAFDFLPFVDERDLRGLTRRERGER